MRLLTKPEWTAGARGVADGEAGALLEGYVLMLLLRSSRGRFDSHVGFFLCFRKNFFCRGKAGEFFSRTEKGYEVAVELAAILESTRSDQRL
jgi:hypothetical protein